MLFDTTLPFDFDHKSGVLSIDLRPLKGRSLFVFDNAECHCRNCTEVQQERLEQEALHF